MNHIGFMAVNHPDLAKILILNKIKACRKPNVVYGLLIDTHLLFLYNTLSLY